MRIEVVREEEGKIALDKFDYFPNLVSLIKPPKERGLCRLRIT